MNRLRPVSRRLVDQVLWQLGAGVLGYLFADGSVRVKCATFGGPYIGIDSTRCQVPRIGCVPVNCIDGVFFGKELGSFSIFTEAPSRNLAVKGFPSFP
jgi:hypothetical protein